MELQFTRKTPYSLLIFLCFGFASIRLFSGALFGLIGASLIGKLMFYLVLFLCLILSAPYYMRVISLKRLTMFLAWIAYCFYCAKSTDMDRAFYLSEVGYIAAFGGLYFVMGQSIARNEKTARNQLYKMPLFLNVAGVFNYLTIKVETDYSMELTYANLASAVICTVTFLANGWEYSLRHSAKSASGSKKKIFLFANLVVSYALVLIGGSRGPLVTLAVISALSAIYSAVHHKNRWTIALMALFSGLAAFLVIFNRRIYANSNIRILNMLSQDKALYSSGRDIYFSNAIHRILENKLHGEYVFHDRIYLFQKFHRELALHSYGSYAHNLFLEVLMQYGMLLGAVLIVYYISLLIRTWKSESVRQNPEVFLFLLGVGFFPLMLSKSYTQTWEFYMLIGYLLETVKRNKKRGNLSALFSLCAGSVTITCSQKP